MKKSKYKYYLYYHVEDDMAVSLYGYTNDKSIAKKFDLLRDTKKVFKRRKASLTKDEVNFLAKEYQSNIIRMQPINTYDKYGGTKVSVEIAMTDIEYMQLSSYIQTTLYTQLYDTVWLPIKYFVKDMQDALRVLGYHKFTSVIYDDTSGDGMITESDMDWLVIFTQLFQDTLRSDL